MGKNPPSWRQGWRLVATSAVVVAAAVFVVWAISEVAGRERAVEPLPGPTPVAGVSPSTAAEPESSPQGFDLTLELGQVKVLSPARGVRPRHLRRPAQRIRATMEEIYTRAFVDPGAWGNGRFPGLLGHFEGGEARRQARRDLQKLSLGKAAAHLDAVRPRRARVHVRFLADPKGRPVSAIAETEFAGRALAEGVSAPIRHEGRYVLRRTEHGWRVAAYETDGRIPTRTELRRMRTRFTPGPPSRKLFFLLAIGSDARPGQAVAGARGDAIQIVAINPRRRTASVVGIPRDSFVPIPGVGARKINEALVAGGPQLMVRTVERLTGIRFHGYVLAGFQDFQEMVSRLGGVEVDIPYRMADRNSGAFFQPGKRRLQGKGALAFARNRYDAPGGDFGRSRNQGRLLVAAFREFRGDFRKNPVTLFRWVAEGSRSLRTNLTMQQMAGLLLAAPTIERVQADVVSGSGAMVGGQSVVVLGSQAQAVFRDLRRNAILGG